MKWSIVQLKKFQNKGIEIDETIDMEQLKMRDPQIRSISPIHIKGRVDIGSNRATFHLQITGEMILPCSRTLEDVKYPIDIHTKETFLFQASDYEFESEDEEPHPIQGDVIDLKPIIEEILLLEIPMQVYSEDVLNKPTMTQSGKGWELIEEKEINKDKIDPRLAGLANFFNEDNK